MYSFENIVLSPISTKNSGYLLIRTTLNHPFITESARTTSNLILWYGNRLL